ncbi:hypothetical protein F210042A8_47630 [Blautia parvula]
MAGPGCFILGSGFEKLFGILCKPKRQSEHRFLGIYLTTKKGKEIVGK